MGESCIRPHPIPIEANSYCHSVASSGFGTSKLEYCHKAYSQIPDDVEESLFWIFFRAL